MDLLTNSDRILELLYLKTQHNLSESYPIKEIQHQLLIQYSEAISALKYLDHNKWIEVVDKKVNSNNLRVRITNAGIDAIKANIKSKVFGQLKLKAINVQGILSNDIHFLYSYAVFDKGSQIIVDQVSVKCSVQLHLYLQNTLLKGGNKSQKVGSLLLLYIKEKVIQAINSNLAIPKEIKLEMNDHVDLFKTLTPPYDINDLDFNDTNFYFEKSKPTPMMSDPKDSNKTNITITHSHINIINNSNHSNINPSEKNEALKLLEAIKEELAGIQGQQIEQRIDILECIQEIEDKLSQDKTVPKFAIKNLLNNTSNLAKIGDFTINLAKVLGFVGN